VLVNALLLTNPINSRLVGKPDAIPKQASRPLPSNRPQYCITAGEGRQNDPDGAESLSGMPTKVNSRWTNSRLLIALHSPHRLPETGLHLYPSEKSGEVAPFAVGQSILCSPVSSGRIAKYGHVSRISG